MQVSPIRNSEVLNFGHRSHNSDSSIDSYSKKQKAIVAGTSAFGVATSLAILAKKGGYSLKPSKMFNNLKNSYISKADFEAKEVISMGVGTCLGGLAGGYLIDKDRDNFKAKMREAIMQIGNISIPISTVALFAKYGAKLGAQKSEKYAKITKGIASIGGLFIGIYTANFLMNKLGNFLFKTKNERGVKATDFSAHVDDMVLAATYVNNNKYVHSIGRIVPVALVIPGFEVGSKKVK